MNAQVKPKVVIVRERYSEALIAELLPLLEDNWVRTDSTVIKEVPLDPDFAKYARLDALDMVTCLTARLEGRLVGYAIFFTNFSLHHRQVRCGHGDVIYVQDEPGLGRVVFALLDEAERALRSAGVTYMGWFCAEGSRIHSILRARGYVDDEVVLEKKL